MTNRIRHYAFLIASYLLIVSLLYLGRESAESNRFTLLFLPLILLAGFWEDAPAALSVTLTATVSIVAGYILKWFPQKTAVSDIVGLGIAFGLVTVLCQDREISLRQQAEIRKRKDKDLLAVLQKATKIQGQMEISEKRLKVLIKLYEVTKKLSSIMELHAMLDEARSVAAKILPHHFSPHVEDSARLAFYLPDDETDGFRRAAAGGHAIPDEGFPERLNRGELVLCLGEDYNALSVRNLEEERYRPLGLPGSFRALIIIPLLAQEITAGFMLLASPRPGAFSAPEFNLAEVLGKQIAFALRKALLYRKVQTLSFTDSQTGLYVHRYFQDRLRVEIHRSERYRQSLSLIMLDMDHFKHVNDKYGHQAGDAVLVEAALRIREMSGPTALVARYGGEEFAVLLPNTPKARALQIAKNINAFLKATPIEAEGKRLTVNISAGVSTYPEDALDRESLITTADTALYEAKRNGRDMVLVYTDMLPKTPGG
jgi:diguanylate cyclase (GGDEF)-like protein